MSFNVLILGAGGVGKSAITLRFVEGEWKDEYNPTIEDSFTKTVEHESGPVTLEIVDTAGYDQFTGIQELLVHAADGFVIVFSVDSFESLDLVETIISTIRKGRSSEESIPLVVVSNKNDLPTTSREVLRQNIESRLSTVHVIEASARANRGIDRAFERLTDLLMKKYPEGPPKILKKKKSAWWRKVF